MAIGLEAAVTCIDIDIERLRALDQCFGASLNTIFSTRAAVEDYVVDADLVVGAVLVPGAATPKLINAEMVKRMKRGSVIVDISIDQGGISDTSRPTTHADPIYIEHEVVHYCVTNMPGAVARTSTVALNNATLPLVLELADKGPVAAMRANPYLRDGLNIHRSRITHAKVAAALGETLQPAEEALAS